MSSTQVSLAEFQTFIANRYGEKDRKRGVPATFMWLMEEVGELASALQEDSDDGELAGEFADVLGWLTTLANLKGVDLSEALFERYLRDGGKIHKA